MCFTLSVIASTHRINVGKMHYYMCSYEQHHTPSPSATYINHRLLAISHGTTLTSHLFSMASTPQGAASVILPLIGVPLFVHTRYRTRVYLGTMSVCCR